MKTGHPRTTSWWDTDYSNHFGASVGYAVYSWRPYLYAVSYNSDRTGTALSAFRVDLMTNSTSLSKVSNWGIRYFLSSAGKLHRAF